VRRFTDEANRLYGVLNNRLYDRRHLAGAEYTHRRHDLLIPGQ
jgi:GST-like protein